MFHTAERSVRAPGLQAFPAECEIPKLTTYSLGNSLTMILRKLTVP